MAVTRLTVVGIILSALCVAVHAQEGKPCPEGHICPVCSEENGIRTCRVERPEEPAPPKAAVPTAPVQAASPRRTISPPGRAAPPPPPPSFESGCRSWPSC
jgi:hypothetical protein